MSETKVYWEKYPDEKPKKEGEYIVTVKDYGKKYTTSAYFSTLDFSWIDRRIRRELYGVIAWGELPDPFDEGENEF